MIHKDLATCCHDFYLARPRYNLWKTTLDLRSVWPVGYDIIQANPGVEDLAQAFVDHYTQLAASWRAARRSTTYIGAIPRDLQCLIRVHFITTTHDCDKHIWYKQVRFMGIKITKPHLPSEVRYVRGEPDYVVWKMHPVYKCAVRQNKHWTILFQPEYLPEADGKDCCNRERAGGFSYYYVLPDDVIDWHVVQIYKNIEEFKEYIRRKTAWP